MSCLKAEFDGVMSEGCKAKIPSLIVQTENKSRAQTSDGQIVGVKTRLKDVSYALTTSKELLKIMYPMWSHEV